MDLPDDNVSDAKRVIDEWVSQHLPSSVLVGARLQEEEDHSTRFLDAYGRAVDQFEVGFTALVEVIDRLNFVERDSWPPHRSVQYALIAHNIKPLRSAMDRLVKGYYEDALVLLRVAYESFIRLVFVSVHRDHPWGALMPKPSPPTPQFNLTGFVRDQLRLGWSTSYLVLSAFTHSNSVDVVGSLKRGATRNGEPERLGPSIDFDPKRSELVLPQLDFAQLAYLRFVVDRLIGPELRSQVPEADVAIEAVQIMTFVVRNHPKPYWREVAGDLDYVFEVIASAEDGRDWKKTAKARPVIAPT